MSEQLIQTPGVFGDNGNFLLERELGAGGMGGVYMGRDKMLDRPVAVKVMLKELGDDAEFVEKFKKEAQAAARLIHPNIVQIYSYGICEGMPYIAMELAAGGSLYSLMNVTPGKTDIQRVLKICQQTAQALQCATDQGVIHGDVKPENILLDSNGNAKLVDFGLAAMQKDTEEIWGTPYYIAPEKVKKTAVDFRADMYSLGATLYHALTGVAPFEGDDSVAVVKKRFEGLPCKPSEIRSEITPAIDALVMKMIELDRENRYPSFEALLSAFTEVLTSGLTQKSERTEGNSRPTTGTRRTNVRGRRVMIKRPSTAEKDASEDASLDTEKENSAEAEDEEESGSLGKKVALFVIGGILAILAVGGGLVWFVSAKAQARRDKEHAQIVAGMNLARTRISEYREQTVKYETEFFADLAKYTKQCEGFTASLRELLPDFADSLKPPFSKELVKAIGSTNVVAAAPAVSNATATAAAPAAAPAAPAVAEQPKPQKRLTLREEAAKYGLPDPGDDFDPAAPDAEEFLAKLKAAKEKVAQAARQPATPPAAAPADAAATAEKKETPHAVEVLHDMWDRVYRFNAAQIHVYATAKKILAECDKADLIQTETEESMKELGSLSQSVKDLYDKMTGADIVTKARTDITTVKSKGVKMLDQTKKDLIRQRNEAARAQKKLDDERREAERLKKLEEENQALIEKETSEIAAAFDAIVAQGCLRQLDWKSALRQLDNASEFFKTAQGQLAKQQQVKKVNCMKKVQDIFISKLKGYVFKGNKLKGFKVESVDEKTIVVRKDDGKTKKPVKIDWQKFYKEYLGNFNEIINYYIVNGRKNSNLNLQGWAEAMTGTALTMRLVCSEVTGATQKAELLAKDVYKQFPEYENTLKSYFPDMTFEATDE